MQNLFLFGLLFNHPFRGLEYTTRMLQCKYRGNMISTKNGVDARWNFANITKVSQRWCPVVQHFEQLPTFDYLNFLQKNILNNVKLYKVNDAYNIYCLFLSLSMTQLSNYKKVLCGQVYTKWNLPHLFMHTIHSRSPCRLAVFIPLTSWSTWTLVLVWFSSFL